MREVAWKGEPTFKESHDKEVEPAQRSVEGDRVGGVDERIKCIDVCRHARERGIPKDDDGVVAERSLSREEHKGDERKWAQDRLRYQLNRGVSPPHARFPYLIHGYNGFPCSISLVAKISPFVIALGGVRACSSSSIRRRIGRLFAEEMVEGVERAGVEVHHLADSLKESGGEDERALHHDSSVFLKE